MRKLFNRVLLCFLLAAFFWGWTLIADRDAVSRQLIRLHVVANSDSERDQNVKLQVRDAVLNSIRSDLQRIADVNEAKAYLAENLSDIEKAANQALELAGFEERAVATLCKEVFDTRKYETFSLPAGIYESLRIVIGDGDGQNWWCVAFPELCLPATSENFEAAAVGAGFSRSLSSTLAEKEPYQLRFFMLDALGKIQSRFFEG